MTDLAFEVRASAHLVKVETPRGAEHLLSVEAATVLRDRLTVAIGAAKGNAALLGDLCTALASTVVDTNHSTVRCSYCGHVGGHDDDCDVLS